MRWGNWELVVSEHPPYLRNSDWSDVPLDDSEPRDMFRSEYWGILGSILDAFKDEKYIKSQGEDNYVQTDRLLEALMTIYNHAREKEILMTPVEAAYSYAAKHQG